MPWRSKGTLALTWTLMWALASAEKSCMHSGTGGWVDVARYFLICPLHPSSTPPSTEASGP